MLKSIEWVSGGFKRFYESLDRYKLNMQWAKSANPLIKSTDSRTKFIGSIRWTRNSNARTIL